MTLQAQLGVGERQACGPQLRAGGAGSAAHAGGAPLAVRARGAVPGGATFEVTRSPPTSEGRTEKLGGSAAASEPVEQRPYGHGQRLAVPPAVQL